MRNPSVAILHYTGPPTVGGVEQIVAAHATLLAGRCYPTRVIVGKGDAFHPDVPLRELPCLFSKDPRLLSLNEELDAGIVSDRFHEAVNGVLDALAPALDGVDVSIVHNAFTLHFNLPLTAALHRIAREGNGPRFVAWCHDLSWTNELYLPKMRDAYPWRLLKEPAEGVTYVAVSAKRRSEIAELLRLPPERIRVVPGGVDPAAQLKLAPQTVDLSRRLGLLEADLLMLAPVRITKRKNLELGLQIAHALLQQGVRAKLVVTGPPGPHNVRSGDYLSDLRELRKDLGIEREALFLCEEVGTLTPGPSPMPGGGESTAHPVSDRMMWDLYSLADLLLFTSSQEGFGIPILDAGLARLPVFCSDIAPFREIGGDAVNYFGLDDPPAAIAERIHTWMERDVTHNLRKRVLRSYSWDSIFRDAIEPLIIGGQG